MPNATEAANAAGAGDLFGNVSLSRRERREGSPKPPQNQQYPHSAGFKDQGTGRDAAIAYTPQVRGRRLQVLNGLRAGPATAEEIGERIQLHWYLVRPRLSELLALGEVVKTGLRGKGALGGAVNLWRLSTPAERALVAAQRAADVEHPEACRGR